MDNQPPMPQRPAGMQAPGIAGAGNILDPEVRAQLRERLQPAVQDAGQLARGQQGEKQTEATTDETDEPRAEEAAEKPAPGKHRAGPYPHGDVDLSDFVANVPPEPVKPNRGRGQRKFYFLRETTTEESEAAEQTENRGPKPG